MGTHFSVFDTAMGRCGIVWQERQIRGTYLPERNESALRDRIREEHPGVEESAPSATIRSIVDAIVRLMDGEAVDLSGAGLDMAGISTFHRRVYELARTIPPGQTLTYGDIARLLDAPGSARAVGQALGRNPFPIIVPCHRVLAAGGRSGGFSAEGGVRTKLRMLAIEQGAWVPGLAGDTARP